MKKLQHFINCKERLCDNPECQELIKVGDQAVIKYRSNLLGGNQHFHERCIKK